MPLFLFLLLLFSCTHAPEPTDSSTVDRPPGGLFGNAQFFVEASQFDSLLQGKLSDAHAEALKNQCKGSSTNPFCPSIKKIKHLIQMREIKVGAKPTVTIRPLLPVSPEWKNGKLKNWTQLRRGNVQGIIKGLLAVDSKELHQLTTRALKEKACPNNIAVAIAATLEDLLPKHAEVGTISELYQKGARCAKRDPVDREHFMTRAALLYLHANQGKKALALLEKVRPTDAFSGRALYWLYRTRLQLEDAEGSSRAFHQLTTQHPFSFHALMALKSVGQDPGGIYLEKRDVLQNRSEKNQQVNLILYQIELLKSHKFEASASLLVDWGLSIKKVETPVRLYLASQGDPKSKVATGSELMYRRSSLLTKPTMELMFPKPYFELFEDSSSRSVSPLLGLAVARKESMFNPRAVSIANAQGLLQLNPDTSARMLRGKPHDLFDPKTNIDLGMRYLEELMKKFSGNTAQVLASYNAGEEAVAVWQRRFPSVDPILWIDLIPYRETRDYVGFVLANYYWYRRLYDSAGESTNVI